MDSIKPWLDTEELNRLANALMKPVAQAEKNPIRSKASQALAKASAIAKKAGLVESTKLRQAELPELAAWLNDNAKCEGLCVIDRDGDILHSAMPNEEWTHLAVIAATDGRRLEAGRSMSLRMKVSAKNYLQFIGVNTVRGSLLVGLLTRNLLKDEQLKEFAALVEQISGADQVQQ
ncbi:hypothetical protein ACFPK9_10385 [Rubritalea spongiae]|uniref:Roadblock/LAMTOR2 domain-containing protein n=1 Tax=Rubritalea spongiae TaxID=430797 RepID=A0ABW5E049_9BACT